jgi:CBS domain-containing protein
MERPGNAGVSALLTVAFGRAQVLKIVYYAQPLARPFQRTKPGKKAMSMKTPLTKILDSKGHSLLTIAPTATAAEAVSIMNDERVGALLVMDGESLVGIFSERDILCRVVGAGKAPTEVTIGEVMTSKILTVEPTTTVEQAMALISAHRCRHLPVIEDGKVTGVVSIGDLTKWLLEHLEHEVRLLENYITGGYG